MAGQRLDITRKLREYNKTDDYQVDQRRNHFFAQQEKYFTEQENVIVAQEQSSGKSWDSSERHWGG